MHLKFGVIFISCRKLIKHFDRMEFTKLISLFLPTWWNRFFLYSSSSYATVPWKLDPLFWANGQECSKYNISWLWSTCFGGISLFGKLIRRLPSLWPVAPESWHVANLKDGPFSDQSLWQVGEGQFSSCLNLFVPVPCLPGYMFLVAQSCGKCWGGDVTTCHNGRHLKCM